MTLAELKLAIKILVLHERGVKDGSGEDSKETSPRASACKSAQLGHHYSAESWVLSSATCTKMS